MAADDEPPRTRSRKRAHSGASTGGGGALILAVLLGISAAGVAGYFIARPAPKPTGEKESGEKESPPKEMADTTKMPATTSGRLADATVAKIKHATVYIRVTTDSGRVFFGSGFFVQRTGYVVTNEHVVEDAKVVEVIIDSGTARSRTLEGVVKAGDPGRDLALVRVSGSNLPDPLTLGDTASLKETHELFIFGFPLGENLGKEISVNKSSVSSFRENADYPKIQMNGGVNPGNSGGPVVDSSGKVVGVVVSKIKGTEINFAITAETVRGFLDRVLK
jgi:S1-C subfamily serine protease